MRRGCRLSKGAEARLSADSDSSHLVRSTTDITGDVTGYARDCDAVCRCSVETVWLCQALGVECPSAYIPIYFLPSVLMCRAFCYPLLNMKRFEIQAIVGKIPRLLCQLRLLYKDFRPSRRHWNISMVWMSGGVLRVQLELYSHFVRELERIYLNDWGTGSLNGCVTFFNRFK